MWAENVEAFELFEMLQTQWRSSSKGPTGLDYNVLFSYMTMKQISPARQCELLDDIRVMEPAALNEIYRKT